MAVQGIKVTLGTDQKDGSFGSSVGYVADPVAEAATQTTNLSTASAAVGAADTAVGTVVTDLTTAFTAYDVFGAALVAITGDTYSAVTHAWTTGGSTGFSACGGSDTSLRMACAMTFAPSSSVNVPVLTCSLTA